MESILAIAIASISILALGQLLIKTTHEMGQSKSHIEAIALAEKKLESFRSYANLTQYDAIVSTLVGDEETHHGANASFVLTWTVSSHAGYKRVSVTVSWFNSSGVQEQVQLSTNIVRLKAIESGKLMNKLSP